MGGGVLAVLLFGAVTAIALEGSEVVVLTTRGPSGQPRKTRTWVADEDGGAWIEAANPERPFLRQLRTGAEVSLRRAGRVQHCHAVVLPNPEGHARIRRLLRAKYGWADWWIGLLTDTSTSVAVRLDCEAA